MTCSVVCLAILLLFVSGPPLQAAFTSPIAISSDAQTSPYNNMLPAIGIGNGVYVAVWMSVGANPVNSAGDDLRGECYDGRNQDLFFARSTDFGRTWSAKAVLKTNVAADRADDLEPSLATDNKGNWMVVWRSHDPLGLSSSYDSDVLSAFSSDDGQTWSAPVQVNTDAATDGSKLDVSPRVATDGQGKWMVSWTAQDPRTGSWYQNVDVAVSSDRGAHWSASAQLYSHYEGSGLTSTVVSDVATDQHGRWVVVWSGISGTAGTDHDLLLSTSDDFGATWSTARALNTNATTDQGNDTIPRIDTDGLGNWVCTWTSNDTLGGAVKAGSNVLYARSTDNGQNWSAPQPVNPNAATSGGGDSYSHVLSDHQGNWIVVCMTRLWGGDLDIGYLTSKDNGAHWSTFIPVNTNASSDTADDGGGFQSLAVTTDGNGHWGVAWDGRGSGGTMVAMFAHETALPQQFFPHIALAPTALNFSEGTGREVDLRTGAQPKTANLTISNTGLWPLTVSSLQWSGAHAADFSIASPPTLPLIIAPESSQNLTIRFAPQEMAATFYMHAALGIASDDPNQAVTTVPVVGDLVPVTISRFSVE